MTRVLVFGGRDYRNAARMAEVLDDLHAKHGFSIMINGGQAIRDRETGELFGADWLADQWAGRRGIRVIRYYANWQADGPKAAGPIRNQRMLDQGKPELGVAFRGGNGTKDMRRRLIKAGVPVIDVDPKDPASP